MKTRLRILRQSFFVAVLAFAFAPQAVAADTILYATDITNSRIWRADVTSGVNTLVTNTPGRADSLIFDANGNILYGLLDLGELGSFNGTTNTILVGGLGHPADLTLEPTGTPSCLLGQTCVLISDYSAGRILRYVLPQPGFTVLASGLGEVAGLTYDNSVPPKLFAVINRNSVAQINPVTGVIMNQLTGLSGGLDGITFDPVTGDLWVSRYDLGGFWKIPTSLSGSLGPYAGSIPHPDGVESDGNGNIFAASSGTNIYQYNIALNMVTQKNAVPGLDDIAPLAGLGAPPGYIEICKASDPNHPVTGLFTFTATPGFSSGPISVPVGQCSGAIKATSGAVTVTETPVLGVAVSNVTAYAYDELGFYHDELNSWSQPDLHAIVNVMAGDQDEETLTTFTNYAAPPGLLKLCKVAGDQSTLGQVFTFTVTGGGQRHVYMVTAGPPAQGGNCVLAGNFPVNTQVMIAETPKPPFVPSGITVNEGQLMPCQPPSIYCAVASVIPGITEVTFTNTTQQMPFYNNLSTGGNPYQCGPTGWPVAGSASPLLQSFTQAAGFMSQNSGSVSRIDVGVNLVSGVNSFYVALYTNNAGLPGTLIARWDNLSAGRCPGLVTITGITGLTLTAGTQYFLVVGPMGLSSTTYEVWNLNNQSKTGTHLYSNDGGSTWTNAGTQTLAAFDVL